ncbi:MAG: hypothetical protein PVI92_07440 [Chromatiales bacterium]
MKEIPDSRPTNAGDIVDISDELGLDPLDRLWLCGMHSPRYRPMISKPNEPLSSASRALLFRMLSKRPKLNPIPATPTPIELLQLINKHMPLDQQFTLRDLAYYLGRSASSAENWMRGRELTPNPDVRRLIYVLYKDISERGRVAIDEYVELVGIESRARALVEQDNWGVRERARKKKESPNVSPGRFEKKLT